MTMITADLGAANVYDLDANVPLDAAVDEIYFTAKRRYADEDADAVIRLALNAAPNAGIAVTDAPTGKFQVQVPADALPITLADEFLVYDCKIKRDSDDLPQVAQEGLMRLSRTVTRAT